MLSDTQAVPFIGRPRSRLSIWVSAIRPKTLFAAASPVIVGTALAMDDGVFHAWSAACALVSSLMIQIGTNLFNDYSDARKGADTSERIGPVRVTQAGLLSASQVLRAAILSFGVAVLSGGYLMVRGGIPIILIGIASIAFGFLYSASRFSLAETGLADAFVLLFFGPVAVGGTYFVQSLQLPTPIIVAGFAPGLLATAILVVNNVRDVTQDHAAGRRTLIVRFGRTFGVGLYAACLTIGGLVPVILFAVYGYAASVLIASLILAPAFPMVGILARYNDGARLNSLLARTGVLLFAFSVLFSIGLLVV